MQERRGDRRRAFRGVQPQDRRDPRRDPGDPDRVPRLVLGRRPTDEIAAGRYRLRGRLQEGTDRPGEVIRPAAVGEWGGQVRALETIHRALRGEREEWRDHIGQALLQFAEQRAHRPLTGVQRAQAHACAPEIVHVAPGDPTPRERANGALRERVARPSDDFARGPGDVARERRARGGRAIESKSAHPVTPAHASPAAGRGSWIIGSHRAGLRGALEGHRRTVLLFACDDASSRDVGHVPTFFVGPRLAPTHAPVRAIGAPSRPR